MTEQALGLLVKEAHREAERTIPAPTRAAAVKTVRHTITCSGPCSASLSIELQGKHGVADTLAFVREIAERAGWYIEQLENDPCPLHGAGLVPRKP